MSTTHRSEREMFAMVEAYRKRNTTQSAFCTENDIKPSTLSYWITRYNKKHNQSETPPLFKSVRPSGFSATERLSVYLPSGIHVSLSVSALNEPCASFIKALAKS
jgi:transposase-like protein